MTAQITQPTFPARTIPAQPAVAATALLDLSPYVNGGGTDPQTDFDTITLYVSDGTNSATDTYNYELNRLAPATGGGPFVGTILIETTVAATLNNLMNAINGGPGAGTKYSADFVASPNVVASKPGGPGGNTLLLTAKTAGAAGNTIAVSSGSMYNNLGTTYPGIGFVLEQYMISVFLNPLGALLAGGADAT